ncbi:2-methoxy-6-polyprenyl-1,4-benzoquinol methylase, mitochondrial-like [Teleopsis dalmanni]|uniref:2-methoxy-6-polyprenyl-1,4-benzoquinol methylase, mitochondrial-like n=1 Tax=Teleopsis dalmanni TaxID=139649 RepID=UPI0018CF57EA|nr:2-methoxy-6-polyprenyl-1,4-benzoquinol methylase, mitochondrial-like [Teleopsis dalmanni]XP_037934407.1 2-methoxy-6-polyprenyl-1,4-benzoquinol methylase, mitochondrial-like [Teleopsis dalmanni]
MALTQNFRLKILGSRINKFKQYIDLSIGFQRSYIAQGDSNTKDNPSTNSDTTHFGFQTVKTSEKEQKVHRVFEEVAKSYDLMNDVMSWGIHRIWKDILIERLGPTHGTKLLDMAGGTGDISFRYLKCLANQSNPQKRQSHVTVSDINQHMLDVGKERVKQLEISQENLSNVSIEWQRADAEKLMFPDSSFDAYTIAFGIRNCTHIDKVLQEAYRVLQPGGRFLCLEFSQLNNDVMQWIYDQYSFQVIPPMGQILAGQWQPYQYLIESIRKFPKQEDFQAMIQRAGFDLVSYENLTFGIVSIHSGFKL